MEPELREYKRLERAKRSAIKRDLRTPKYRPRIVRDKKREAARYACRRPATP